MIDGRRVLGIVPARAGSVRLPGKNVRLLGGRPLIAVTLDVCAGSTILDHLLVSTDDEAVMALARDRDIAVVRRPPEIADASASVVDAVAHALAASGEVWDYVVLLQPTSPFRTAADIDAAVDLCHRADAPAVISVSAMPKPRAFYGRIGDDGVFLVDGPDAPERVVINGAVYVIRPEILMRERSFQPAGTLAYAMPSQRSWDIDTPEDFAICEALWSLPVNPLARPE